MGLLEERPFAGTAHIGNFALNVVLIAWQIVDELDKYVVGQSNAKRAVAVALFVKRRDPRPRTRTPRHQAPRNSHDTLLMVPARNVVSKACASTPDRRSRWQSTSVDRARSTRCTTSAS